MKAANVPAKFPIPFASGAGPSYIQPIPVLSQQGITPGRASLTDGYPPSNFIAEGAGGTPTLGQDWNGLNFQITAWCQWVGSGGPIVYDAAFSTAIGGYPKGAQVASATTFGVIWFSTADDNTSNPDASGANWVSLFPVANALLAQMAAGTVKANLTGGSASPTDVTLAALKAALGGPPVASFQYQLPSGTTNTEALSPATWTQRALNTTVLNNITSASLSSNQIHLPAGTYEFFITAPAYNPTQTLGLKSRLRNVTDGATALVSSSVEVSAPAGIYNTFIGEITIASPKVFEVDSYPFGVSGTSGGGQGAASGEVEVYTTVYIRDVT